MNSSWVVQPVKKCIKHYTYKNSHILWMFAGHHNFVVTFLQHKLKKNLSHTHTHTRTQTHIPFHSGIRHPESVVHGTEFREARRSGPVLRAVRHLQGLAPLAGETQQRNPH